MLVGVATLINCLHFFHFSIYIFNNSVVVTIHMFPAYSVPRRSVTVGEPPSTDLPSMRRTWTVASAAAASPSVSALSSSIPQKPMKALPPATATTVSSSDTLRQLQHYEETMQYRRDVTPPLMDAGEFVIVSEYVSRSISPDSSKSPVSATTNHQLHGGFDGGDDHRRDPIAARLPPFIANLLRHHGEGDQHVRTAGGSNVGEVGEGSIVVHDDLQGSIVRPVSGNAEGSWGNHSIAAAPLPTEHLMGRALSPSIERATSPSQLRISPPTTRPPPVKPHVKTAPPQAPTSLFASASKITPPMVNEVPIDLTSPSNPPVPFNSPMSALSSLPPTPLIHHMELPPALFSTPPLHATPPMNTSVTSGVPLHRDEQRSRSIERRKDIRTPLIRSRLVEGQDVRFVGVALRSPARPCFSAFYTEAANRGGGSMPHDASSESCRSYSTQSQQQRAEVPVPDVGAGSIDSDRRIAAATVPLPEAAAAGAPTLCSVWTTTKTSTFINNF